MIRRICYEDVDEIIKLENETINTTLGKEMLDLAVKSDMAYYYVYLDNNKVIGYISSSFDGITIEILNFCVYKEYQGKGIGTKLLNHLLNDLYKRGAINSILEVRESNINATNLYSRFGYKNISVRKNYYSNGENAIVMQKVFTPYSDLYQSYMENVSIIEKNKDYISYKNDDFKEKYDYNKYEILDGVNIDKVLKKIKKDNNRKFLEIEYSKSIKEYVPDMVESHSVLMHTNIQSIKLDINHNDIREYNNNLRDDYIKYTYNDDLKYDTEYAKIYGIFKANLMENNKNYSSYLIYDEGKLIGLLDIYIFMDSAFIENYSILEEYRLKGYGKSLFMGMINDLKKKNIYDIFLDADYYDTPIKMYEKWGFERTLEYYTYHEDY